MKRGRKPAGLKLVDDARGSEFAKERTRIVLQTLSGELTVAEACTKLNISRSRFYELQHAVLDGAVAASEPQPAGRPPEEPEVSKELEEARRENARLEKDLQLTRAKAELSAYLALTRSKKKPNQPRSKNG